MVCHNHHLEDDSLKNITVFMQGPDGTRGFGMGRGSHLQSPKDLAAPGSEISSMFAGLRLRGIFPEMNRSLSVEAAPFVPPVLNPRSVPQ